MNKNTLPMPVKIKPYAHQQNAFDFVCGLFGLTTFEETSSGAALLMEMGTGKSLVGLAITGILFRFSLIERVLVVCPLSIIRSRARCCEAACKSVLNATPGSKSTSPFSIIP